MSFSTLINFICITNSIVLSLILLLHPRKNNFLLVFIISAPSIAMLANSIIEMGYFEVSRFLHPFSLSVNFLWSPIFLLFVLKTIGKFRGFKKADLIHLVPFLISIIYLIYIYTKPSNLLNQYFTSIINGIIPVESILLNFLMILQMLYYFVTSYFKVNNYQKEIKNEFSEIENIEFEWIKSFVIICLSLWFITMLPYLLFPKLSILLYLMPIGSIGTYIFIVYKSMKNSSRIDSDLNIALESMIISNKEKLSVNSITSEEMNTRYNLISEYLKSKKPYLNSDINITRFASDLNENVHTVSIVINQKFNMNFFDLINYHRVEEAKRLLTKENMQSNTIENIAFEVGFNTPSSFYRAFKKHTNKSPKKYIESLIENGK